MAEWHSPVWDPETTSRKKKVLGSNPLSVQVMKAVPDLSAACHANNLLVGSAVVLPQNKKQNNNRSSTVVHSFNIIKAFVDFD
jgi:hypothetical protein